MQPGSDFLHTLANKEKGRALFALPSAGASPLSLMLLARSLPARAVCSFAYAGMGDDREPHDDITEMAAAYVEEMCKVDPDGPFRLAGYCFGGLVAYAMAAQLEAAGLPVERLVLIECFTPTIAADGTAGLVDDELQGALQCIYQRTEEQYRRLPPQIVAQFQRIFWLHLKAGNRYQASPIRAGIRLIRTASHPDRLYQGWERLSMTSHTDCVIPGDTFSILTHPHVQPLAHAVEEALKHSSEALSPRFP